MWVFVWGVLEMRRTLSLVVATVGLVALAPASYAFQTMQSGAIDTMSSQSRLADPDDLMQGMQDAQTSGTMTLPGGAGSLQFNSNANAPGGANSPFLPPVVGTAIVPSLQH
jgi:hypothetical protein